MLSKSLRVSIVWLIVNCLEENYFPLNEVVREENYFPLNEVVRNIVSK